VSAFCEGVRALLEAADVELVVCDVGRVSHPDLGTVDALARLQLTARRCGRQVLLRRARLELEGLLALTGLSDVLSSLSVEPRGQAEQGEPPRGLEEERDPGDPIA
jgi:hypothetical protein